MPRTDQTAEGTFLGNPNSKREQRRGSAVRRSRWSVAVARSIYSSPAIQVDPAIGLFAEPPAVAPHAVNLMRPAKEAILGIVGPGTIGLALLVVLRDLGFESIFIIDRIKEKLEMARNLGAKTIQAGRGQPTQVMVDK